MLTVSLYEHISTLEIIVFVGPQSLCNQSFWCRFMLSRCFLDLSVGVGAFVTGLSQISSFCS